VSVAVVGGGWAGLAAAVTLADAGVIRAGGTVTLFEAAPTLGGRARAVSIPLAGRRVEVDNGQHLMLGAYRSCLEVITRVAGAESAVLQRHRMRLAGATGLSLAAAPLPAPLHLLGALARARGLSVGDRFAMLRMMARLTLARWRVPAGLTVAALLRRHRQPVRLVEALWEPLCVGALNTGLEHACAQAFCAVLRDSLGASARASDFLLPHRTLSDVLPRPAERWLRAHGVTVHLQSPVRSIAAQDDHWWIDAGGRSQAVRDVIVALPPYAAARVLTAGAGAVPPGTGAVPTGTGATPTATGAGATASSAARTAAIAAAAAGLGGFTYERIATVYVAWQAAHAPRLAPWWMLREDPAQHHYGQWIFDRGEGEGLRVASVVISARGRAADLDDAALGHATARQLVAQLGCRMPDDVRVIDEKRATFRCTPDRPRPAAAPLPGPGPRLLLAGDYLVDDYPATLESAVRSGISAARTWLDTRPWPDTRARRAPDGDAPAQVSQATDSA